MSGAIMPEPCAMPAIVTVCPPISTVAEAPLGKVSVVMIARAAASTPPGDRSAFNSPIFAVIRSWGSGSPMTPVEDEKTRASGRPSASATADVTLRTASIPALPVNALAFPEFTTIAAPSLEPLPTFASQSSTGAARVDDRVKAPATAVPGAHSTSMTSARPAYRTPAAAVAKRTPSMTGSSGKPSFGARGETAGTVSAAVSAAAFSLFFSFLTLVASFLSFLADLAIEILFLEERHVPDHRWIDLARFDARNIRRFGQLRNSRLDRCTLKPVDDFVPHLLESRRRRLARLVQLYDVPAELRLDRVGHRALVHRDDGFLERRDHHPLPEPAEIAAIRSGRASGPFPREFGKIGAGLQLREDRLRLFLGFDENVRSVVFHFRLDRAVLCVVGRLYGLLGQAVAGVVVCDLRRG